jgi:hypothetical protein
MASLSRADVWPMPRLYVTGLPDFQTLPKAFVVPRLARRNWVAVSVPKHELGQQIRFDQTLPLVIIAQRGTVVARRKAGGD